MRRFIVVLASLAAVAPLMGAPFATARAAPKDTLCMASTTRGGASAGRAFIVLVSAARTSDFEARGFAVTPCSGKENSLPEFRRKICELASAAPPAVLENMEAIYRVSPAELCAMAEELSGK